MIRRRVGTGRWILLSPGVYSPAAVPDSWQRRLSGACLAGGPTTVASHRAAGALWKFDGRPSGIVEVTVAGSGVRHLQRVVLHRTRSLPVADRTQVDGIPVTRPGRTLVDLAAVLDEDGLEAALDSAVREGLVTVGYLDRRLAELGSPGRNGIANLRELIDDRREGRPADSQAENRVRRALVAAGLPKPVRQFELYDHRGLAARFDLAYPRAPDRRRVRQLPAPFGQAGVAPRPGPAQPGDGLGLARVPPHGRPRRRPGRPRLPQPPRGVDCGHGRSAISRRAAA